MLRLNGVAYRHMRRPIQAAKANISSATIKSRSSDVHKLSIFQFSPSSLGQPLRGGSVAVVNRLPSGWRAVFAEHGDAEIAHFTNYADCKRERTRIET